MLRVAVAGDSAYVYHTKRLPTGHGFHLYRADEDGNDEQRLTDRPVRGIQRPSQLPVALGARYDWLEERYDEDSPAGVYYTMRGDWTTGLFAAFLDPDIARALGLLNVDDAAPVGDEVTYRVEFVDDRGEPTGEELTKTVLLEPTPAPTPQALEAEHEERRVTLSWTYPTSTREDDDKVIRFDVYRVVGEDEAQRVNGDEVILRNAAETDFSYSFSVPRTGREETFFVAAVDITGRIVARSEPLTYRVTDNVPPSPVGGVEVYDGESGKAQVTWSMHPAPDLAGYHLYRAPRLEAEFKRITEDRLGPLETSYLDTTVVGRTTYHYRVTAVDSAGNESEKSNAAMAQVVDHEPPPSPTNLDATFEPANDGGRVRLQWSAADIPEDLRTFQVLRRRLGESTGPTSYGQAHTDPVLDTTFVDGGLGKASEFAEGAYYRYAVVALDSARNVSDSTFTRIQIPDRISPAPPAEVQALNEDGVRALVKWSPSTNLDVTAYRVYRRVDDGPDTLWTEVAGDVQQVPDRDAEPGRQYRYAVSAVDSLDNEGNRSDPATIEMRDFDAPAAVRNVQAQVQEEEGVRIRWETVSANDMTGYQVYRSTTIPTGIYEPVNEDLVAEPPFSDAEGEADMWYRVRAVDSSGNESRPSQPARAIPPPQP
jgi:fibronectin type 3 domain-containing protein